MRNVVLCALLALVAFPAPEAAQDVPVTRNAVVRVTQPMIVGFFPPSTDSALENDDGTIEGIAHMTFAIEDALNCIVKSGKKVEATIVLTSTLVIVQDSTRRRIRLSRRWPASAGAYLLAPGKSPRAVAASSPGALSETLIPEAAAYFRARQCLAP